MVIDYFPNGGILAPIPSHAAPGMHHEAPYLNVPIPGQAMPANSSEQNYSSLQGKSGAEMNSGEKAPGMNHDVPMMYGHQGLQFVPLGGYGNYTSNQGYIYRGYPCALAGRSER